MLRGDAFGACDGFEIMMSLDADEPDEVLAEVFRLAHRMCFTEVALQSPVTVSTSHVVNGEILDLGRDGRP
ncbi:MAG: hypothetical protein AAGD18_18265 [Actinomycetota bacterium]